MKEKKLSGRVIAVLAADGFEMVELSVPVHAMRLAGAKVDIISLHEGRIRGVNLHEPAHKVKVDASLEETHPDQYDALFIPGGFINPDMLRQSHEARQFVRAFDEEKKPIAVICHAPWVLASADLLAGRHLTSWPGIRDDMVNAGAIWLDQPVVRDGNLLSSRGPEDLAPFVSALLEHFGSEATEAVPEATELSSAPRHDRPPEVMVKALRFVPKPSLRTALGLGALVAGALFAGRRRAA